MNKLLLTSFCMVSFISFAQQPKDRQGNTPSSNGLKSANGILELDTAFINTRYVRSISTIAALRSFTGSFANGSIVKVSGYRTKDDGGGGDYIWNDTDMTDDDGGGIIKVNSIAKGRFIHAVNDGIINLKWWGIRAWSGTAGDYDISTAFNNAQAFMKRNGQWVNLYIPADNNGDAGAYYSKRTLHLQNSINISGDASPLSPKTRIEFLPNTTCIRIPYKDQSGVVMHTSISNIEIFQTFTTTYGDSTAHGIHARSVVSLNNVRVSFASGNGFHLEGCQSPGNVIEGTVDFSELINCQVKFTNHGLYLKGCDANKVNIYKFNASAIRRWGIYDDGFLGNTYVSPHFAFCGSGLNSDVVVTYGGKHYAAISSESIINRGFRPDLFPAYWEIVTPMGKGPAWDSNKKYWSGGPYNLVNVNAKTTMIDPYFEGFQPNAINSAQTMSINGTRGVNIKGGVDLNALNGLTVNTSINISGNLQGLRVNNPSTIANYPGVAVKSHESFPTIFHEGKTGAPYVFERYKNKNNDDGYLYYDATDFKFYANNINSATITPNGLSTIKLHIPVSGSSPTLGTANLRAGIVTVKTTAVTPASKIYLTVKTPGGTQGFLSVPALINGTSFTIHSTSKNESSTVNWWLIN